MPREAALVAGIIERRGEVVGDAPHRIGAEGLHPHLLGRIVQSPRIGADGTKLRVRAVVVIGEAKRQRIGLPAQLFRFRIGDHPRRLRQHDLPGAQLWPVRAKRNLKLLLRPRQRARALRQRPLEDFDRGFLERHSELLDLAKLVS